MPLVNRDHLNNTPKEVISTRIVLYAVVLSFSGSLHGFNTANISGVLAMTPFIQALKLNKFNATEKDNFNGWVTSALLLGSCLGSLLCAPVSDRFGRNKSLSFFSFLFVIAGILMATLPDGRGGQIQLLAGRVLSGLGSGAASVIGTAYIAEIAPKAIRGGLAALYNANTMLGVGLAYWVNYGSLQHISSSRNAQWQVPMAVQTLPGLVLIALLPFVPESPRWLLSQGRNDAAARSLEKLRHLPLQHEFVLSEFNEIRSTQENQKELEAGRLKQFFQHFTRVEFRRRFLLVAIIQVFFQLSGGNIITYYNTSILTSIGLKSKSTNFLFSGIYGLVKFCTVILYSAFFVDRFGRRSMVFAGSGIIIASLIYMSAYLGLSHPESSHGTGAAGWLAVVAIYIFAIGYAISWATIPWIINSEVFPIEVRSTSMATIIAWQCLVNFALTRALPNMSTAMHPWGPFALFACVTTVAMIYCYFALPETKGLSLEEMKDVFDAPWYRVGRRSVARLAEASQHADLIEEIMAGTDVEAKPSIEEKECTDMRHKSVHGRKI